MLKGLVFLMLLMLVTNIVLGQQKGVFIVDSLNKVPVQFAIVQSGDLKFNQVADENGFVSLKQLLNSSDSISVSCVGFQTKSVLLSSLTFANKTAIIYLQQKVSSLSEVLINTNSNNKIFSNSIHQLLLWLRSIWQSIYN